MIPLHLLHQELASLDAQAREAELHAARLAGRREAIQSLLGKVQDAPVVDPLPPTRVESTATVTAVTVRQSRCKTGDSKPAVSPVRDRDRMAIARWMADQPDGVTMSQMAAVVGKRRQSIDWWVQRDAWLTKGEDGLWRLTEEGRTAVKPAAKPASDQAPDQDQKKKPKRSPTPATLFGRAAIERSRSIAAYIRDHGPSRLSTLATALEMPLSSVSNVFRVSTFKDWFCKQGDRWTLTPAGEKGLTTPLPEFQPEAVPEAAPQPVRSIAEDNTTGRKDRGEYEQAQRWRRECAAVLNRRGAMDAHSLATECGIPSDRIFKLLDTHEWFRRGSDLLWRITPLCRSDLFDTSDPTEDPSSNKE